MAQAQQTDKGAPPSDQSGGAVGGGRSDPKGKPSARPDDGGSARINEVEQDPIAMLKADHREVEGLFSSFEKAPSSQEKARLTEQICTALMIHTLLEEEIFYPACKGHMEDRLLNEAQVEHDGAKTLIIELQSGSPDDPYYDAKVKVLSEDIKHHVAEEEKPSDGIFVKALQANVSNTDLARKMRERKQQLTEQAAAAGGLGSPETRSFRVRTNFGTSRSSKEDPMARNSMPTLERDDRGRFIGDDDREHRGGSSDRSRYRDDDDRRMSRRDDDDRRYSRPRDEEGRFTNSRSRSRDDDDERRGHGGWFGDRAGHAEAARRGWDEREGPSRSRSRDDDDDRRYSRARDEEGRFTSSRSRSRDDDDEDRHYSRARDEEGRFTGSRSRSRDDDDEDRYYSRARDEEGRFTGSRSRSRDDDDEDRHYSRARDEEGRFTSSRSRSRDDDDDRRGSGGWFGDRARHAEASRRGWDEREGPSHSRYRDDDDRRTSRSHDDDDDRRYSRARDEEGRFTSSRSRDDDDRRGRGGHGGWFGDAEGHSEAARRGRR